MLDAIECHPATPDRWHDLEAVFAGRGDPAKCWCSFWYLSNKAYSAGTPEDKRSALQERVKGKLAPGVLAYADGLPAGWAGIAPRATYDRLVRNRQSLRAVDERPVWSLTCLVVHRDFRRQGLMRPLIRGAVDFAVANGAIAVEAYPVEADRKLTMYDLFVGTISAYQEIGFVEVARHTPTRPILRYWPEVS